MSNNPKPPGFFALLGTQISDFCSKEWKNFQKDLLKAYRDDLSSIEKPAALKNLPHFPSVFRASLKVLNKTRLKAQQKLSKGKINIRNHTIHGKNK